MVTNILFFEFLKVSWEQNELMKVMLKVFWKYIFLNFLEDELEPRKYEIVKLLEELENIDNKNSVGDILKNAKLETLKFYGLMKKRFSEKYWDLNHSGFLYLLDFNLAIKLLA